MNEEMRKWGKVEEDDAKVAERVAFAEFVVGLFFSPVFLSSLFLISLFMYSRRFVPMRFRGNALHESAYLGDMVSIRNIIHETTDGIKYINIENAFGLTPLHIACENGQFEVVELLLVLPGIKKSLKFRKNERSATPLTCAKFYKLRYGERRAQVCKETYGVFVASILQIFYRTHACHVNALRIEGLIKDWAKQNKTEVEF
jgi:hypothetical protein